MARNIVWPFACFSTQRIELPHKDQIHGSGLLACRARMLSFVLFLSLFFFFFFLSYFFLYPKKKNEVGKKTLLEFTSVVLGALLLQIEKLSYKMMTFFLHDSTN